MTVLCHPQASRAGERAALTHLASGREVRLSRTEPLFSQPGKSELRPLADVYLSRKPLRLVQGPEPGSVRLVGPELGAAVEVDGSELAAPRTVTAADLERGVVLLLAGRIVLLLHDLDPAPPDDLPDFGLVGESEAMGRLRWQIRQVADLDVPVLLRGETGTGKELVAHAIHGASPRRGGPFRAVNMAAIPPSLAAAEIFGAAKGAFTGAERHRKGYFVQADGGSLFLDEVGEMPVEVQALLLRALETGEIQPVGADRMIAVDARLIAATDADLEAAIDAGRFRAPLLHRVAGYEIRTPALRHRRDDFGRLFYHFLRQELVRLGEGHRLRDDGGHRAPSPWLPAPLVARLAVHPWPGNVRQLKNVARELVISSRGAREARIGPQIERLLSRSGDDPGGAGESGRCGALARPVASGGPRRYRKPSEVSEEELLATLRANRFRLKPTAAEIGVSRTSLYALIESCPKIRKAADLAAEEIEAASERSGGDLDAMAATLEVSREGLRLRLRDLGRR